MGSYRDDAAATEADEVRNDEQDVNGEVVDADNDHPDEEQAKAP